MTVRQRTPTPFLASLPLAMASVALAVPDTAGAQSGSAVRTIKLRLPGHKKKDNVRYRVLRGRAIFQGDIDLGPAATLGRPEPQGSFTSSRQRKRRVGKTTIRLSVRSGEKYLWPGGRVPFEFDSNVQGSQTDRVQLRTAIMNAVNFWNNNTNLRFVRRSNEKDRIRFKVDASIPGAGRSAVGRQGGRQDIKLKINASQGTVVHEMGHAIGLWHEQSRADRDENVEILFANVRSGTRHNFDKHVSDGIDFGPYDPMSTMHYSTTAFAKRDPLTGELRTTIRSLTGATIQPSGTLSALDIAGINRLYPDNSCGRVPSLFDNERRRGPSISLEFSRPRLKDFGRNDKASSLCVPIGWTVELFENRDYKGKRTVIEGPRTIDRLRSHRSGGTTWNDKISSVRVTGEQANPTPLRCETTAIAFEHDHYRGRRLAIQRNVADLHQGAIKLGDKISSLCVPNNVTITLFKDKGYRGENITIVGPFAIADLKRQSPDETSWGDQFSSARIGGANVNRPPAVCRTTPVLFADDNFRGRQFRATRQARDLKQHRFGDKASSVCVPSGWTMTLYEHKDFKGRSLVLPGSRNVRDLKRDRPGGRNWGDKASSFRLRRPAGRPEITCTVPTMYEHDNFRGRRYPLNRTVRDLHGFRRGDKASSICVPSGWSVTVYEDKKFKGRAMTLRGQRIIRDLKRDRPQGRNWGDKISSVRVTAPAGTPRFTACRSPTLYHDDHYRGRSFTIGRSNRDIHQQGNGDKASSVCVPPGASITVYENKNFRGRSLRLNGPREIFDLKRDKPQGRNWGDKISSVRVN